MLGISDIEDIAGINKDIYALCSDAKEIIENTAFPMLAMAQERGNQGEEHQAGPSNIVDFDPDAPIGKPFWLEAPHSSLAEIREYIRQHRRTILQIANLLGIYISGESKQPVAGVAMEIENQQRNAALSEKADNMEQSENQILKLYAAWQGETFDGSVLYSPDFSVTDSDKEVQTALEVINRGQVQSPLYMQELQKKMVKNTLPKIEKAKRNAIYTEIEKQKTIPVQTTNKQEVTSNG